MSRDRRRTLRDGIVALYYGLLNLFAGRSFFHTARELGLRVVGEGWAATGTAAYAPVLAYNAVHGLAFVAVGLGAAWLVFQAERHPRFWFLFFLLGISALAALAVGGYLYRRHPQLRTRIEEAGADAL